MIKVLVSGAGDVRAAECALASVAEGDIRSRLVIVIEHRINEELEDERRASTTTAHERGSSRQIRSGAITADSDALLIKSEPPSVRRHPFDSAHYIIQRRRVFVLRC